MPVCTSNFKHSYIFQFWWHLILWMFVFKMLLVRFWIWHLCLEIQKIIKYLKSVKLILLNLLNKLEVWLDFMITKTSQTHTFIIEKVSFEANQSYLSINYCIQKVRWLWVYFGKYCYSSKSILSPSKYTFWYNAYMQTNFSILNAFKKLDFLQFS